MLSRVELPKGVHDILPQDEPYWSFVEERTKQVARDFSFFRIRTPIIEKTDLFVRGLGRKNNIVAKEMYSFKSRGDDALTLRPEGSVPIVRSYIENGMKAWAQPVKLFYFEPFFRHRGGTHMDQRQFFQIGFEALGLGPSVIDAELIETAYSLLKSLGITHVEFQVNSLGDSLCRPAYLKSLQEYFKGQYRSLCSTCQKALGRRVFSVFDCQEEKCLRVTRVAPKMIDGLCDPCRDHFKELLEMLDEIEVPYALNPFIVRALDYYSRTVFEVWPAQGKHASLDSLGGGGRYDALALELAGEEVPASGFALYVERIIGLLKDKGLVLEGAEAKRSLFLAQLGFPARKRALRLLRELLEEGIVVSSSFARESLSSQLRMADREGVEYALILGEKELTDKSIILRNMKTGNQEILEMRNLMVELKERLGISS